MHYFLILVFSLCSIKSISQNASKYNDSIYINTVSSKELKSKIKKYNKGDFYDLTFVKPETSEEAIKQNFTTLPVVIIYNPKGQKLCKRRYYNDLPPKIDLDFIKENFKPCYKQYREDKNGEKIPELIPYNLDQLLSKTEALTNKEKLNPKNYSVIFPWKIQLTLPYNNKVKTDLKAYFKKIHKTTKNKNFNLIRLNRDIQKSWSFGDSLKVKLIVN
ncbi:hypothetical protein [Flavobacteriaceae bacterium 14752]|uniref:hypothetical protein n=1 Tax=Mesohalobacter salilacus TaxID=2491711 RepID=UPI000F6329AB|nr:hypothetical protein EIG84_09010 [Flavobacteriaceae bacterium 14752]